MSEVVNQNMNVWNQVCETPIERTQEFSYTAGGRKFRDVNPQYRVQCLTEQFGPCGQGWGYDILERWRENWGAAECCYVMLRIWYMRDGVRCETGPQIGGTMVQYSPDECWKMSVTDALGKCAALLGVAADIYLGTFDTKYRDRAASQPSSGQVEARTVAPVTAATAKKADAKPVAPPVTAASQQKTPF